MEEPRRTAGQYQDTVVHILFSLLFHSCDGSVSTAEGQDSSRILLYIYCSPYCFTAVMAACLLLANRTVAGYCCTYTVLPIVSQL